MKLSDILTEFEKVYMLMLEDHEKHNHQYAEYNLKLLREWIEELRRYESNLTWLERVAPYK